MVPLNKMAKEIREKYKDYEGKTLLPFISSQKYNDAIKVIFAKAGITRNVLCSVSSSDVPYNMDNIL